MTKPPLRDCTKCVKYDEVDGDVMCAVDHKPSPMKEHWSDGKWDWRYARYCEDWEPFERGER